jgi:plasmid stabilization system protein ParE
VKRSLLIRLEAERDLESGLAWYHEQRPGLGHKFISAFEQAVSGILRFPDSHPCVHGNVRRCLLRRFPYGVFYMVEADCIIVLAVMHASRDPHRWQSRE